MFTAPRIKELLEKYGIAPLKKLGQNFLTSEGVLRKIAASADLKKTDVVLEIGPGFGVLTAELAREAAKVIAVEKDKKMVRALKDNLAEWGIENVSIIHGDVLKTEMKSLLPAKYKVVANIPYYITSPIIRKFLEKEEIKPELIVLLVQKEVARRICAKPPRLNLLAISVQFFGNPKIEFHVPAGAFYPKPKVDSALIKITPFERELLPKKSINGFFNLVRAGFSHPRKQLAANLASYFGSDRGEVENIFEKLKLGKNVRAENLTVEDWLALFGELENRK